MEEAVKTGYEISIPIFEGPMDLLLHLVTKNRIDIHDIPIHEITDQYLAYLEEAKAFDLNLGSQFFSMASTLILIKSRMLLPRKRQEETDPEDDPRQELARSLEEFKEMKEMRARLAKLLEASAPYRMREPTEITSAAYTGKISLARLTAAFFSLYDDTEETEERILEAEEVSFDEKAETLRGFLRGKAWKPVMAFFRLQRTRLALAVSLVALLELIRIGEISLEEQAEGLVMRWNGNDGQRLTV